MADRQEMAREHLRAGDAVGLDEIALESRHRTIDEHERKIAPLERHEVGLRAIAHGRDDEPFGPVGDHVLHVLLFEGQIAFAVAEQDAISRAACHRLGPAHEDREEGIRDVRHDETQRPALAGHQAAGDAVRNEVELGDGPLDAPPCFGTDARDAIDHARDRHGRDAGSSSDVTDGGVHRGRSNALSMVPLSHSIRVHRP